MFAPTPFDALLTVLVGNVLLAVVGISVCGLLAARMVASLGPRAEHGVLWTTLALMVLAPCGLLLVHGQAHGIWRVASSVPAANPLVQSPRPAGSATPESTAAPADQAAGTSENANLTSPPAPLPHGLNATRGVHLAARLAATVVCLGMILAALAWLRSARTIRRLLADCRRTNDPALEQLTARICADMGIKHEVTLACSRMAPGPLTLGIRQPWIVLPEGLERLLDEAELRGVLTHEAAHIARRDALSALIQRMVNVVYWWNPLLAPIQRGIRRTREHLCDDCVLRLQGDGLPLAGALVKVATWMLEPRPAVAGAAALLADQGELTVRMTRLLTGSGTMRKTVGQIAAFALGVCATLALGFVFVPALVAEDDPPAEKSTAEKPAAGKKETVKAKPNTLAYNDGSADGKKSLGGSGEMISFTLPKESSKVRGVRIHGSRYGMPQPPKEDFMIYFLSQDQSDTLATKTAPYSRFKRGPESWVEIKFPKPIELPQEFWVALDFRAQQTKGVYVSYDASTDGSHSRIGLPGVESRPANVGGDWMIELLLED